jgi:hypothetical protein
MPLKLRTREKLFGVLDFAVGRDSHGLVPVGKSYARGKGLGDPSLAQKDKGSGSVKSESFELKSRANSDSSLIVALAVTFSEFEAVCSYRCLHGASLDNRCGDNGLYHLDHRRTKSIGKVMRSD